MYSYKVLSELGNGSLESFADTRLVASDGASVRVHWPLLVARDVWWTRSADQDRVEDGDRVIIFDGVTIQELRTFVSDIYCDFPCYGWNPLDIPKPLKIVAEEEDDGDCTVQWGASHQQAEAEAGKLPLGLVAAPAPLTEAELSVLNLSAAVSEAELTSPAVGASSDCVLADFAEAETEQLGDLVNSDSVFEAGVTSPVSERGAGHQGPAEAGIVPLSLVAAPALSDNSDCVLAESAEAGRVPLAEEAAVESEAGVTSPVPEWGAGHQGPTEAGTVPLGLVAAPVPATAGNSDFVPAESEQESPLSQPPVLQCPDCGKVKQTQKQLRDHLRVHRKRVCEHCGQVLSVTTNMKSHIRRCQKDNVFQCNICNYKCPRQFDLDRHMNTHRVAPYKGYPCEKCDYVSTTKKDLRKHNREHPKYPCPKCGMKFYKKDTLDRHIQFHSDMVVETSDGHWFKLDSSQVKQRHKEKIHRCLLCSYSRYKFNFL